ncbi:MAG: hypothetical protein ACOC2Q_04845 [Spirochaetota bacterium]
MQCVAPDARATDTLSGHDRREARLDAIESILATATLYGRVIIGGSVFQVLNMTTNNPLRAMRLQDTLSAVDMARDSGGDHPGISAGDDEQWS